MRLSKYYLPSDFPIGCTVAVGTLIPMKDRLCDGRAICRGCLRFGLLCGTSACFLSTGLARLSFAQSTCDELRTDRHVRETHSSTVAVDQHNRAFAGVRP